MYDLLPIDAGELLGLAVVRKRLTPPAIEGGLELIEVKPFVTKVLQDVETMSFNRTAP